MSKFGSVGPMAFLNDAEDDPNNSIDDCWEYAGVVLCYPSPDSEGYIP